MSAKRGALSLLVAVAIAATGCAGEGSTVEIVRGKNARTNVRDVAVAIINPQPGEVVQNPVRLELVLAGFELGDPTPGADERATSSSAFNRDSALGRSAKNRRASPTVNASTS